MINLSLIESSTFFFQSKLLIYCIFFQDIWRCFAGWYCFSLACFFIFRLKTLASKKYASTNGKDSKYTNTIDKIWLYCRLYWRLFCRLFFAAQYFFFSFFQKCSKFMALNDTSRMFFLCYYFFSSSVIFYLIQNIRGYSFRLVP